MVLIATLQPFFLNNDMCSCPAESVVSVTFLPFIYLTWFSRGILASDFQIAAGLFDPMVPGTLPLICIVIGENSCESSHGRSACYSKPRDS